MYKIKDMKRFLKLAEALRYMESEGKMYIKFYKGHMIIVSVNGSISMIQGGDTLRTFDKIYINDLFKMDLVEEIIK